MNLNADEHLAPNAYAIYTIIMELGITLTIQLEVRTNLSKESSYKAIKLWEKMIGLKI
jgi:hypothetical protein